MTGAYPNFEPIYHALAVLLLNSATVNFTATAAAGASTLGSIADTSVLTQGIALNGAGIAPGTIISEIVDANNVALNQPTTAAIAAGPVRAGFVSIDPEQCRLLKHWNDVESAQQPALFLTQVSEGATKRIGQPNSWTLRTKAWIYCQAPNDRTPTVRLLNVLLAAIRTAMAKDKSGPGAVQNRQTLGGLVLDSYIDGVIDTDEGFLGQQGVAIVPIELVAMGP